MQVARRGLVSGDAAVSAAKDAVILAKAIIVYDHKYERPQRAGNGVSEQKMKEAWDAIVAHAKAVEEQNR